MPASSHASDPAGSTVAPAETSETALLDEAPAAPYSAPMRLWHWVSAFLISAQLITILFQRFVVQARSAVPEFQQILSADGITLTEKQGRALAHVISERIWEWHVWLGLALAGFWLLRVGLEVRGPAPVRFSARLLAVARRYRLAPPAGQADARKALLINLSYALFYAFLTVMTLTGLGLTYAHDFEFLDRIEHELEEIHNVTMYLMLGFAAVHIVGVVWSELTKDHGLISRMVGGK